MTYVEQANNLSSANGKLDTKCSVNCDGTVVKHICPMLSNISLREAYKVEVKCAKGFPQLVRSAR